MKQKVIKISLVLLILAGGCASQKESKESIPQDDDKQPISLTVAASNYLETTGEDPESPTTLTEGTWLSYDINVEVPGRYRTEVFASFNSEGIAWIEDYIDNKDGRTYDVTGKMELSNEMVGAVEGSPLNAGLHKIKVHASNGEFTLDKVVFTLMVEHQETPQILEQNMTGEEWYLVWSDEFDSPTVDTTKWTYDIGDWGWGNNELQYYTSNRKENARIEDGNLVIEAKKDSTGDGWTSARLTTRGKTAFTYGKIEFRAKVPREKGNWAAGWTLGDSYVDEISWPYCGEIDILESVGYEVDNETGDGIAHATVHTPAYYFKINNQISSTRNVTNIAGEFHTYAVEWTPGEVRGYVDGEQYYLYDKNANELEWPFNKPQNIILNLAMGGGWGGAKGMDPDITSQLFLIDYVRVYGLK